MSTPEKPSNVIIQTCGVGGAWASVGAWQNQVVVDDRDSERLIMFDCSGDARHSLAESGIDDSKITDILISHLHGDHIHGLEWIGFKRYCFGAPKPNLYVHKSLLEGLRSSFIMMTKFENNKVNSLEDYFNITEVDDQYFSVGPKCVVKMIKVPHIDPVETDSVSNSYAFELLIRDNDYEASVVFSNDCRFCPEILEKEFKDASLIFHDCSLSETATVHPPINLLKTLPLGIRRKIILYHCSGDLPIKDLCMFRGQATKKSKYTINLKKRKNDMTFADALNKIINEGKCFKRSSWPKDNFVFYVQGSEFIVSRAPLNTILPMDTKVKYSGHIDMYHGRDESGNCLISTWSPSSEDINANDWVVAAKVI